VCWVLGSNTWFLYVFKKKVDSSRRDSEHTPVYNKDQCQIKE